MARNLGVSLLARSTPGSTYRNVTENRALKPDLPQEGLIGSVARNMVQEPLERAVTPGSNRIISNSPALEGQAPPTDPTIAGTGIGLAGNLRALPADPNPAFLAREAAARDAAERAAIAASMRSASVPGGSPSGARPVTPAAPSAPAPAPRPAVAPAATVTRPVIRSVARPAATVGVLGARTIAQTPQRQTPQQNKKQLRSGRFVA